MNKNLVPLAVAIVIFLALAGGYAFLYQETLRVNSEAATLVSEIAAKESAQARSASVRARLTEVSESETLIAAHLLAKADIVSFLEKLETSGDPFGANVYVASVSDPVDGRITISLSIEGSFPAIMKTLGSIENGTYVTKASNLTFSASGDVWSAVGTFVVLTEVSS